MTPPLRLRSAYRSASLMLRRRVLRAAMAEPSLHGHARFAVLARDTVSEEVLVAGLYEEALLLMLFEHLFKRQRSAFSHGVALDIGANIGNHSVFMGRYFARVVSVEPNPTALALLRCNLALAGATQAHVLPVGFSDRPGTLEFRQNDCGNLGGSGFTFAGLQGGQPIACEVVRGDDVLTPEVLGGPLLLVKVDIEGAELAALTGMAATLVREQPLILFESNRSEGPGGGREVFALLRGLGYAQFLSIDEVRWFPGRFGRLVTRVLSGERLRVLAIDSPDRPPYSLIVAVPHGRVVP